MRSAAMMKQLAICLLAPDSADGPEAMAEYAQHYLPINQPEEESTPFPEELATVQRGS